VFKFAPNSLLAKFVQALLAAGYFLSLFLLFAYSAVNAAEKEDYQAMYSRCLEAAGPINNNTVLGCSEKTSTAVKKKLMPCIESCMQS
jgi:hypothetical protein